MSDQQRKRSDGRETMSRVMDFALAEFNKVGPDDFNLDRVLEKSGISRSSVYHHFGGRHGVIAAVEAKLVEKDVDLNNIGLREFVNAANNAQEILAVIKLEIAQGSKEEDKVTRQRRASTFVAAQRSTLLYEVLQSKQREATEYLCETLQILYHTLQQQPQVVLCIGFFPPSSNGTRNIAEVGQDLSQPGLPRHRQEQTTQESTVFLRMLTVLADNLAVDIVFDSQTHSRKTSSKISSS